MCEWVSMIPGIATRPSALITVTSWSFSGGTFASGPTSAILPSRTRIDPLAIVPLVTVRMVASLMNTLPPVWIFGLRLASNSVSTSTNVLRGGWSSGIVGGVGATAVGGDGLGLAAGAGVVGVVAGVVGGGCAS